MCFSQHIPCFAVWQTAYESVEINSVRKKGWTELKKRGKKDGKKFLFTKPRNILDQFMDFLHKKKKY